MGISVWMAVLLFVSGLFVALLGSWEIGALVFSFGVVVLGAGSLAEDRVVGMVLMVAGVGAVVGVLGHIVTGVGP